MAHDLLVEPVLSWRDARRRRDIATLPGILARLATGELADFPRVRAHQFHPWCMFLTQLAAIALRRAGKTDPQLSEDQWGSILLELTEGTREPWCLVVDDLCRPAFFQPPVPEGTIEGWSQSEHPDDIDILVTSKAHDVKSSLISGDDIEAWILALVTLQTMQGYSGGAGGYNGISRMKRGYGSRPRVGLAKSRTPAARFSRDLPVLLETSAIIVKRGFNPSGLGLAWLAPWDGKSSLGMSELAPHFIEVCRRLRCRKAGLAVACAYTTSKSRRSLPEIESGDVGDPWIPIEREGGGALTVGGGGFHYQLLTRILFEGDFEPSAAQALRSGDNDPMLFLAAVMVRGQGKTEGLHERALLLTAGMRNRLGQPDTRAAIGRRAGEYVQQAKKMRSKVLFPALKRISLGENTPEDEFDARVDEVFFDDLFRSLDQEEDDARLTWERRLREISWAELQRAIDRCCVPSARWYQAVSDAEGVFRGSLSKHFPTLVASLQAGTSTGAA